MTRALPVSRHPSLAYAIWSAAQRLLAGLLLLLLAPFLFLLYPAVRLGSPGPFLYSQMRPGRDGKPFRAYKIRTMRVGADRNTDAARSVRSGDPMVTPIGRALRRMKVDELPQLYNVLRGDMALVELVPNHDSAPTSLSADARIIAKALTSAFTA